MSEEYSINGRSRPSFNLSPYCGWATFRSQVLAYVADNPLPATVAVLTRYGAYLEEALARDPDQAKMAISSTEVAERVAMNPGKLIQAHDDPVKVKAATPEAAERKIIRKTIRAVRRSALEKHRHALMQASGIASDDMYADTTALEPFDHVLSNREVEDQAISERLCHDLQPIVAEFLARLTKRDRAVLAVMLDLDEQARNRGEKADLDAGISQTLGVTPTYVATRRTCVRRAFEAVAPPPIVAYIKQGDHHPKETTQATRYLESLRAFLTAARYLPQAA